MFLITKQKDSVQMYLFWLKPKTASWSKGLDGCGQFKVLDG